MYGVQNQGGDSVFFYRLVSFYVLFCVVIIFGEGVDRQDSLGGSSQDMEGIESCQRIWQFEFGEWCLLESVVYIVNYLKNFCIVNDRELILKEVFSNWKLK